MNKYIYSTIILMLLTICLQAQNSSLSGKVLNDAAQPVVGASVIIKSLNKGTATSFDGKYIINNISDGEYKVTVSVLGYETLSKTAIFSNNQSINLDFTLIESFIELQDVEIIGRRAISYKPDVTYAGTKIGTKIIDIPQSITLLNKEMLDDQQIYRMNDIAENVAGLTTRRPDGNSFVSRGFRIGHNHINGNRVLINSDFSAPSVTTHYERVEVIKGPAAALFGNSSPGGVVNAVTKKPLKENRASASFTMGSFNTKRATFDITGPLNESKKLLYRLNVGWEDAETFRDFQKNKNLLIAPSFSFIPNEKTSINVDIVSSTANDVAGIDRGMPILQGDLFALPISFNTAEPYDNRQNTSLLFTVTANHKFSDKLSFNASYSKSDFNQNFLETRSRNRFTDDGTELIRQINDRVTHGKSDFLTTYFVSKLKTGSVSHELLLGFDYYETKYTSTNRTTVGEINGVPNLSFSDRIIYNSISELNVNFSEVAQNFNFAFSYKAIYLQDLITFNKLKLLLGLRYEEVSRFGLESAQEVNDAIDNTVLLPRLGLTYSLNDNINLFASYSESFQMPAIPFGINSIDPGAAFRPMASQQLEFGVKANLFKERLFATISLYDIARNGRLIEDPDAGLISIIQLGDEKSRGVELEMIGKISANFSISANAAFNDVEVLDDRQGVQQLELENNNPETTFGFWGKYDLTHGFLKNMSIALGGNFVGESKIIDPADNLIDNTINFDSYFTAKAGVYYSIKNIQLSVNVNNIFDERYYIGGLNSGRIFPGAPRNFLARIEYSF